MQPKRFLFNLKIDFSDTLGADVTDTTSNAPNAKQVLENQEGCGVRGSEGTRIIGGSPIKKHEYPWLCSLKLKGGHICGITLISVYPQQTILVGAAHCYNRGEYQPTWLACEGVNLINTQWFYKSHYSGTVMVVSYVTLDCR